MVAVQLFTALQDWTITDIDILRISWDTIGAVHQTYSRTFYKQDAVL